MNPLTDVLPPQVRKYVYAVLFVVGLGVAAWQATDGDWAEFVAALVLSLGSGMAGSNVNK